MVKTDISDYWRHTWCGDKELPQDNTANEKSRIYGGEGEAAVVWAGDKVVYAKQRENLYGQFNGFRGSHVFLSKITASWCYSPVTETEYVAVPVIGAASGDIITVSFDVSDFDGTGSVVFSISLKEVVVDKVGHYTAQYKVVGTQTGTALVVKVINGAVNRVVCKNIKGEKNIVDTQYSVAPSVKDNRVKIGKHYYHTTQIGKLIWTAENLNEDLGGGTWEGYYNNDPTYGVKGYGKLYTWDAICKANETPSDALAAILPDGWRVPTKADFDSLVASVGSSNVAKVKEKWYNNVNGTNDTGFSSVGGGYRIESLFESLGEGRYWSATSQNNADSWRLLIANEFSLSDSGHKLTNSFSVRLVRDAATATALLEE